MMSCCVSLNSLGCEHSHVLMMELITRLHSWKNRRYYKEIQKTPYNVYKTLKREAGVTERGAGVAVTGKKREIKQAGIHSI